MVRSVIALRARRYRARKITLRPSARGGGRSRTRIRGTVAAHHNWLSYPSDRNPGDRPRTPCIMTRTTISHGTKPGVFFSFCNAHFFFFFVPLRGIHIYFKYFSIIMFARIFCFFVFSTDRPSYGLSSTESRSVQYGHSMLTSKIRILLIFFLFFYMLMKGSIYEGAKVILRMQARTILNKISPPSRVLKPGANSPSLALPISPPGSVQRYSV